MVFPRREAIVRNTVDDRAKGNGLRNIAAGASVRFSGDQAVLVIRVLCHACRFQRLRIQHNQMSAERHEDSRFIGYHRVHIMPGERPHDALQAPVKPSPVPANSPDYRGILVLFGVGFQLFLNPLYHAFGRVRLGIRYNIAETACPQLRRGLRDMHMRVPQTGDDALSVAVNDFRGLANPRCRACFVSDVCELAVLDGKRLRARFRSVQRNGINLRVPVNPVRNLCHLNYTFLSYFCRY